MVFLKYNKNNVWDMFKRKYVGPDYDYVDLGQVHTQTAIALWKEGHVVFSHHKDEKILKAYEMAKNIAKNMPDEFYYGTSLKFAPKFVIDYVLKNWEYKTNDLGYEMWHELDVDEITVKIKDGEFTNGIVFIRYDDVTIPMLWRNIFKDGE